MDIGTSKVVVVTTFAQPYHNDKEKAHDETVG